MRAIITRLLIAYAGAAGLSLSFLPLASIFTMGGHSLMFVMMLASPVGVVVAISYADSRRGFQPATICLRSGVALIVLILTVAGIAQIQVSPFFINDGWLLVPVAAPLLSAGISEFVCKKSLPQNLGQEHSLKN